ncbi:hypothetical protein JMJ77_0003536 [Colletotrichum scovillei]|uniref:Uncharacterized protein n=1 Tax=Colletotrichum scovillei TaxID=1209932 RepID=A0A9P7QTU1_9PEZI|nr:hypothetical protein JMJ78_0005042 [Colletotrichum scovillei]KAG7041430.1 hypothetical protein JMJ77_0003536 [Colletotrichum scovillei]KAG7061457.1 hypothetical protein JMJ76_0001021 [Colletotrichum scovillei]
MQNLLVIKSPTITDTQVSTIIFNIISLTLDSSGRITTEAMVSSRDGAKGGYWLCPADLFYIHKDALRALEFTLVDRPRGN